MAEMNAEKMKRKVKMLVSIGMILWIIGFVMVLSAIYMEFWGTTFPSIADSISSRTLITLKLGGIGFTLGGIFLALVAIAKILMMMPMKLAMVLKKK